MGGAWIVFVFGLLAVVLSIPAFWRLQRARSYLPVPGRIIERSVVGAPWFRVTGGWGPYVQGVKYRYWVGGREYTSDRFALVPHRYGHKRAQEELTKVPDELTVFVNPRNPADAVVDRQGAGAVILTFCVGAIVMLYALSSIFYR
jgi:hypothetical protein